MKSNKSHKRMCICCGQMKDKPSLIRIIKNKDGDIIIDKTGKLNGRGAYICNSNECKGTIRAKKALERAFKGKVPECTYEMLEEEFSIEA